MYTSYAWDIWIMLAGYWKIVAKYLEKQSPPEITRCIMLKVFKGIYFTILDQISLSLGTRKFDTMSEVFLF